MHFGPKVKNSISIVIVLILSIISYISPNLVFSKVNKNKNSEKFFSYSCYAYRNVRSLRKEDFFEREGFNFLGINKLTGQYVFLQMTQSQIPLDKIKKEPWDLDFEYDSQSQIGIWEEYFPTKETLWNIKYYKNWFFVWLKKSCKEARYEGDPIPDGYIEVLDDKISSTHKHTCYYRCRSIYMIEKGLCKLVNNRGPYVCGYLVPKK